MTGPTERRRSGLVEAMRNQCLRHASININTRTPSTLRCSGTCDRRSRASLEVVAADKPRLDTIRAHPPFRSPRRRPIHHPSPRSTVDRDSRFRGFGQWPGIGCAHGDRSLGLGAVRLGAPGGRKPRADILGRNTREYDEDDEEEGRGAQARVDHVRAAQTLPPRASSRGIDALSRPSPEVRLPKLVR